MSKETDSFLSNECMNAIIVLSNNYPNDMDFGKVVRSFIQNTKQPPNKTPNKTQIKIPFDQPDI